MIFQFFFFFGVFCWFCLVHLLDEIPAIITFAGWQFFSTLVTLVRWLINFSNVNSFICSPAIVGRQQNQRTDDFLWFTKVLFVVFVFFFCSRPATCEWVSTRCHIFWVLLFYFQYFFACSTAFRMLSLMFGDSANVQRDTPSSNVWLVLLEWFVGFTLPGATFGNCMIKDSHRTSFRFRVTWRGG